MITGDSNNTFFDDVVSRRANDGSGQECDQHGEHEPLRFRVARQIAGELQELSGVDRQKRQDGAKLDQNFERPPGRRNAEQPVLQAGDGP